MTWNGSARRRGEGRGRLPQRLSAEEGNRSNPVVTAEVPSEGERRRGRIGIDFEGYNLYFELSKH